MKKTPHPIPARATGVAAITAAAAAAAGRFAAAASLLILAAGCGSLLPDKPPAPTLYALDSSAGAQPTPAVAGASTTPTLAVQPSHAAAGFDSARIVYQREPHSRAAFAHSEWVDSPARMLTPLIVASLQQAQPGAFRAVLTAPGAAAADLRLDTDIVRLQHEFNVSPSQVRFTLRATLTDTATRRVLAARVFEEVVPARSEDAKGGVIAANAAVQSVLAQLSLFCAQAAQQRAVAAGGGVR